MNEEWARPLMSMEDVLALPPEIKGKVYHARAIAYHQIQAIKNSSLRLELGQMSSEQAAVLLGFVYAPVRYWMAYLT